MHDPQGVNELAKGSRCLSVRASHHRCRPFIREVRLKKDYSDYEEVANCEFDIHFVDSNKG